MASNDTQNCPEDEVLYEDASEENGLFALALLIFCVVYVVVGQILYLIRQRKSMYLRHRFSVWVYVTSVGVLIQCFAILLREYLGRASYPCWVVRQWMPWFALFQALPVFLRAASYYYTIRLNQKLAKVAFSHAAKDLGEVYGGSAATAASGEGESASTRLGTFTFGIDKKKKKNRNRGESFEEGSVITSNQSAKSAHSKTDFKLYFYIIDPWRFGLHGFCFGFLVIFGFSWWITDGTADCTGCDVRGFDLLIMLLISIVAIPLMNFWFYTIRKEPDPLTLKWEMGYILVFPAGLLSWFWGIAHFVDPGNLNRDGVLTWHYIWIGICLSTWTCMVPYQIYRSYQYDRTVASWKNAEKQHTLAEILESTIGEEKFKVHLVHELCIETLLFWREGNRWKEKYSKMPEKTRVRKLLEINETYVKAGSPLEINVSWRLKNEVQTDIDNNTISETTLDKCIQNVYGLMESDIYSRFVVSDLYNEFSNNMAYTDKKETLLLQESI